MGPNLWSVRSLLFWLVLACLLPGILGAAALIAYDYRAGLTQLEGDTLQTARALVQAVDHRILQVQTAAQILAADDALQRDDLPAFHGQARRALAQTRQGTSIALADRAGRQVLNSAEPFGRPLPPHGNPALVARIIDTGRPAVSDIYVSNVLRCPLVAVGVPVKLKDGASYALTISVLPEEFTRLLAAQNLPAGWVGTIYDSTGTIVARSREAERFTGEKPADAFLQHFRQADEGTLEAVMRDGVPVLSAYTRSPLTRWRVAISIPRDILTERLNRRLSFLAFGVAGLFAVGLGLAALIGGRIARSFRALIPPALALGSGRPFSPPAVEVREAAEVARALGEAAGLLAERDAALKQLNRDLRDSEHRLSLALAAGNSAVWEMDVAGGRISGGDDLFAMYGYAPGELETLADWEGLVHEDDRPALAARVRDAIEGRTSGYRFECRLRCKEGAWRWNLTEALVAERDAGGRALRLVGTHSNIDARKGAEEALRRERSRLQAIIDNSPLLILVKDMDARVVLANWAVFEHLDVPPREALIGRSIFESFPRELAEARWMQDLAAIDRDAPVRAEETLKHVDGTWHTYMTVRFPVHDIETGELIGVCAISTDITERKAAETEVRRLNAELEKRVEERTAELERSNEALLHTHTELQHFAHATAHDLKTPLRSIVGFAQLLQQEVRGREDGRLLGLTDQVVDNTRRLQSLIDDLLAYTRLEAQGLPFEPVDLGTVAAEAAAGLEPLIRETGAEVDCAPLPTLAVDRFQLVQVFRNLIENGIKYNRSRPPRVTVSCRRRDGEWLFSVTDNGIGIDPRHHQRIFEVFRRLHAYHHVPGSGIGLALCRRIVERHGGRIWVESRPGEGSTFQFTLPAADGPG